MYEYLRIIYTCITKCTGSFFTFGEILYGNLILSQTTGTDRGADEKLGPEEK